MARTKMAEGQMELPLDWESASNKELLVSWRKFTARVEREQDRPSDCKHPLHERTCALDRKHNGTAAPLKPGQVVEVDRERIAHLNELMSDRHMAFLEGLDESKSRFDSDFECVCAFESLYRAHRKARLGKLDFYEVLLFEERLGENLANLRDELLSGEYRMRGYYSFVVHEPKERLIHAAHYVDRVVLHSICDNVLTPVMERRLIYDNAACRKDKGTHFALDRFEGFLREHYRKYGTCGYALKCDVTKYFASIDHETLIRRLRRVVRDRDVLSLLEMYIRSYHTEGAPGVGLPLGNQSSQTFALFYLDPVDRLIKERFSCKHYIRYMDDFIVVHHDKDFLRDVLGAIQALCGELKLSLNDKTRIIPLKQGVEFLGWRFLLTDSGRVIRKVRKQTKKRFKRRMGELAFHVHTGRADGEDIRATLASYRGHFKHGDAYMLRKQVFEDFWRKLECQS